MVKIAEGNRLAISLAATANESGDTATEDQKAVTSEAAIEAQRPELVFPAKLTEAEYQDIAAQVYPLPPEIAQQMPDVIESKRRNGQIKINPAESDARARIEAERRERERETLRISLQARECAYRSLATMKVFPRGHAKET